MKIFKYILSALLLTAFVLGCEDDDQESFVLQEISAPSNVNVIFEIAQDDSGVVSITPSAEGASSFQVFFGDEDNEMPTVIDPGETAMNTYSEGEFIARVIAVGLTGLTSEFAQNLVISFRAPENLEVIVGEVEGDITSRTIAATADFATMFNVFFGDVENEEPTQLMIGETITHTYATAGTFTLRVVAISAGSATIETSQQVTIAASPVTLPVDFESQVANFRISGFEGADSAIEENPFQTGINTSATVLRSTKTDGAQFFAGTVLELDEPIDFSSSQTLQIDTYSPKAAIPIRIAIENQSIGGDSQVFVDVNTTVADTWETLMADFSTVIDPNIEYDRVVVFFEFIVDLPGDGSTYFYDNLRVFEEVVAGPVELPVDFEEALNFQVTGFEGADSAIEENPFQTGINTSATVLRSTKTVGAQFFAGTILELDTPIDFSAIQALQIDTYSPKAAIPIRIAIENQSIGGDSQVFVDVNTTVADTWETLMADFSTVIDPNIEYNRVVVFFEFIPDLPGDGSTYFYDNLRLASATAPAVVELPVDFESTTLMYEITGFEGADSAVEENPFQTGINTSATVLRSTKTVGAQFFAGTILELDTPIDFSAMQALQMSTYSPKANIPIRLALENQVTGNQIFVDVNTTVTNTWEALEFDFSSVIDPNVQYDRVVVFFEFIDGLMGDGSTYFYDDLILVAPSGGGTTTNSTTSFPVNFETAETGAGTNAFRVFENDDNPPLNIIVNSSQTGINTSTMVAEFTARANGQEFAGTETFLTTPFTLDASNSTISIMVWKSVISDVGVQFAVGAAAQPPIRVANTLVNEWEELIFDFSGNIGLAESIDITTLVIFPDFGARTQDNIILIDNVTLGASAGDGGGPTNAVELPVDFESTTLMYDIIGFEGADSAVDANPDANGINTSTTVLRSTKTVGAQFFAGTILNLDTPIDFGTIQTLLIDTYSPKAAIPIRIALENQSIGGDSQVFVDVNTTVVDTWETLMVDFSNVIDSSVEYDRVVVFFEFIPDLPGDGSIYYYDNLRVAN